MTHFGVRSVIDNIMELTETEIIRYVIAFYTCCCEKKPGNLSSAKDILIAEENNSVPARKKVVHIVIITTCWTFAIVRYVFATICCNSTTLQLSTTVRKIHSNTVLNLNA